MKCWNGDPSDRPTFSELVILITSLLEEAADYLDLTAVQSETCVDTEGRSAQALHLDNDDTDSHALESSAVIVNVHTSS